MEHIIRQQVFDIAYTDAGKAHDLQNKISDIFNHQLVERMERLFDRLVPEDKVLMLNELSIDIGSITYAMLDHELADRIITELERELTYRLSIMPGDTNSNGDEQEQLRSIKTNYTGLLEHFLLTGTMPWWATGELMLDPVKVITYLLEHDAANLRDMIIKAGQSATVRQRLVYQFSDEVIRQVIALLEPAEAGFIFNYHTAVIKLHKEDELIESAPADDFDKALWLFILTYLLVDRGSVFNQKVFVRSTLAQIARHYNREYAEVLLLLNRALNNIALKIKPEGQLPFIIDELYNEEANEQYPEKVNSINKGSQQADKQQSHLAVIKHYLLFGSLPWWTQPYSAEDIAGIFTTMLNTEALLLKTIIISVGQQESVRKRMVTVFNDDVIAKVVTVLEPANAQFILNYVDEVQQLHTKNVIVKADSKDFRKAVWLFVLDFLLVERGSEFNQLMFLQSNIKKLAQHYNVQYADVLSYFVQSISQLHQDSIKHAPLFKLLAVLLNGAGEGVLSADKEAVKTEKKAKASQVKQLEKVRLVQLKDVLLYWLQYGFLPWWAQSYTNYTPADMVAQLLSASADDVVAVFKYAGTDAMMRQRLLYQLPAGLIMEVMAHYPQGAEAIKLYQYLLATTKALKGSESNNLIVIDKLLIQVLWEVYLKAGYQVLNVSHFISAVIKHLVQHTQTEPQVLISALKKELDAANGLTYSNLLDELIDDFDTISIKPDLNPDIVDDVYRLITAYLHQNNTPLAGNTLLDNAFDVLNYFLLHNQLPGHFKGKNPAYINAVIGQLVQFLDDAAHARLIQMLQQAGRAELHQQIVKANGQAAIAGGVEQLLKGYKKAATGASADGVINEALKILEYYLVNNRLPQYLAAVDVQTAIKQLLVLLNYQSPAALRSLLQKDGHAPEARISLHSAFTSANDITSRNISQNLKAYFEKDILLYVSKVAGATLNKDMGLATLLSSYLSHPKNNNAFILQLLKQQSVTRHIAISYTDELVYSLLNQNAAMVGGEGNIAALKQLYQFLNQGFTDTLLRDRFGILWREFNLLVLGGSISAQTPEAYIKAFLKFISAANAAVYVQIQAMFLNMGIHQAVPTGIERDLISDAIASQQVTEQVQQSFKQVLNKPADEIQKQMDKNNVNNQLQDEQANIKPDDAIPIPQDTIYINNAGLVLLNPFLATYFVRLGLMHEGKFIDTDKQLRAVHLLQYLVNGSSETPEHELVLNKILCNVPVAAPVPLGIVLTDQEKEISEQLFKAVLHNWEKLKNTSTDGFKASFLQRNGLLNFKDEAWHLKVEQRGYDVLLQTLPWNYTMIRTPWMENFLYTEWT